MGDIFFGSYTIIDIYLTVACIIQVFVFYGVLLTFIAVGITDYYRRYILLAVMGRMVDPNPTPSETSALPASMKRPQFIDLTIPHNIPAWFTLRQVLTDVGFQYRERITMYTSYMLLLAVGLTASLIYQWAIGGVLSLLFIASITCNALSILLPICSMVLNGTRANRQFDFHIALLMRIRLCIRETIASEIKDYRIRKGQTSKLKSDEKQLQSCDLLLGSALEILNLEKNLYPITILGLPASLAMVQGIGSIAAGAIASGAKLFSDHQN